MNSLVRMLTGLAGLRSPFDGKCPICGSSNVKSAIRQPLGPIVKDGPTVLEMKCRKCGHRWSMPIRVGP
ncbi:MAG: hypothetical protein IJU44_10255 [Kiritimatiellae bacterium]|nr:hypothetical protein [Kiritimatiellia bacterium]